MSTWKKLGLLGSLYLTQGLPYGFFTQALPVLLRVLELPDELLQRSTGSKLNTGPYLRYLTEKFDLLFPPK